MIPAGYAIYRREAGLRRWSAYYRGKQLRKTFTRRGAERVIRLDEWTIAVRGGIR